ncbi:hypothetical protein D3C77_428050 [compost metagenome]
MLDPLEGPRIQTVFAQLFKHLAQGLLGLFDVSAVEVGVKAHYACVAEAFPLAERPIGQTVLEPQLFVKCPVQIALQQVEGLAVLVVQHGLQKHPMQAGAVAEPATG